MTNTTYTITDRATNNWLLDTFATEAEAEARIEELEADDRKNGNYKPDYYQIITNNQ